MSPVPLRQNPYVGPRAFRTGEALYGRNREIQELLDLLIAERLVLLHSPSGAGKSSLVQAGLIPRLRDEGFQALPLLRVNLEMTRDDDRQVTNAAINRYELSVLLSLEEAFTPEDRLPAAKLAGATLSTYLDQLPARKPGHDSQPTDFQPSTVLIFDQFEEVLTLSPADRDGKQAFFSQLGTALRDRRRWALFIMREDYVAALTPYLRPVPTRLSNTYRLDLLGVEAALQAIQSPAQQAGIRFDDQAARDLVDDLRKVRLQRPDGAIEEALGPYVEPVQLQVVCYRLWDHLSPEKAVIDQQDVAGVGDVDTALADYYAESVEQIARQVEVSERAIREWVERQLITDQGIRGQVLKGSEQSGGLSNQAVTLIEHAHLIRAEKRGGATWFELTHDRLIDPIRRNNAAWLDAHLSLLQRQAALWEAQARPDHLLLRGQALTEADAWATAHASEITPTEKSFLTECRELQHREEEALIKAEQDIKLAEQARTAAMLRRRAYALTVALVVTLVMTVAAFYLGNLSRVNAQNAQAASTQAVEQQVKAEAASTLAINYANSAIAANTEEASQRAAAQAASTQAVAQQVKAEAASTQAVAQQATAVAERNIAATAQAEAETQRAEAERQSQIAFSRQLASLAQNYLLYQPDLGLLLGIESYQITNTLQARSVLLTGLQNSLSKVAITYGAPIPEQGGRLYSITFSPDGRRLAWGGVNGQLVVWDIEAGKAVWSKSQDQPAHNKETVYVVLFSIDGETLITGGADGKIVFWDAATGEMINQISTQHSYVLDMALSPDGDVLASGGIGKTIYLWDTKTYQSIRKLAPAIGNDVWGLAWSPDGSLLASCGEDQVVRVWDGATGNTLRTFKGHPGRILTVAWASDGKHLLSGGEDAATGNKFLFWWDVNTGQSTVLTGHSEGVSKVVFSPDGKLFATGSEDNRLLLWSTTTLQPIQSLGEYTHWILGLAFSPRGKLLLASASFDRSVVVYSITQEMLGEPLVSSAQTVKSLAYDAVNNLIVVSGGAGRLTISGIQTDTGNQTVIGSSGAEAPIVAYGAEGQLALGYTNGKIEIQGAPPNNTTRQLAVQPSPVLALAFSADGQQLASAACQSENLEDKVCTQSAIYLWNTTSGELIAQLPDNSLYIAQEPLPPLPGNYLSCLAFSPDGSTLASGSQDRNILLWDIQTRRPSSSPMLGHRDAITSLVFGQNGMFLASGSADGQMILWDLATLQPIGQPFLTPGDAVTSLAFQPDGNMLASGSADGQIMLWDIDITSWITRACDLAGRNLTQAEWAQFFPGQTYRQTCPQFPPGP